MDPIPNYLVVASCCHASSDCEDQLSFECFVKEVQYFIPLFIIRKIGCPMSAWELNVSSFSTCHAIIDHNGSALGISIASRHIIFTPSHCALGLVSDHCPIDSGADRALDPLLIANELFEAPIVHEMGAGQ